MSALRTGTSPRHSSTICAFVALLALGGCAELKQRAIRDADLLEERLRYSNTLYADDTLRESLQEIVERLLANQPPEIYPQNVHVLVQHRWRPRLILLQNGALYVSTGLLARLQNEAHIAAFFARELIANSNISLRGSSDRTRALETAQILVGMLTTAGYPAQCAEDAFLEVEKNLQSEGRKYGDSLSERKSLQAIREAIASVIVTRYSAMKDDGDDGRTRFEPHLGVLLLTLATADLDSANPVSAKVVLDRYEAQFGANGRSRMLQAAVIQKQARDDTSYERAIAVYLDASRYAEAPPLVFKELGFLYRRRNATAESTAAFREYLRRSPNAIDAAIVETYIGNGQ